MREQVYQHSGEETLPIHEHCDRILTHIDSHDFTIIQGDTGCTIY